VAVALTDPAREDLGRGEGVDGDVEESLDGLSVEVDGDHSVGAGELDDVGH